MREISFKSERENSRYQRKILEALLVSSISEDNSRLPTSRGFILSGLINGTIRYIGGNSGRISYAFFEDDNDFEYKIFEYLENQIKLHGERLDPKIKETIVRMCEPLFMPSDGPGRPTTETDLYYKFNDPRGGAICSEFSQSTFSLSYDFVVGVQKNIIPNLSESERKDVLGIGEAMREFVLEDLEFIRKTCLY